MYLIFSGFLHPQDRGEQNKREQAARGPRGCLCSPDSAQSLVQRVNKGTNVKMDYGRPCLSMEGKGEQTGSRRDNAGPGLTSHDEPTGQ